MSLPDRLSPRLRADLASEVREAVRAQHADFVAYLARRRAGAEATAANNAASPESRAYAAHAVRFLDTIEADVATALYVGEAGR